MGTIDPLGKGAQTEPKPWNTSTVLIQLWWHARHPVSLLLVPWRTSEGSQGSHPAPYIARPGLGGGSFYFPACWGCLQSGARTVCTNAFLTSVTATLGESEIPVQTSSVILFWVITADFFNSLVGQMMVWDPLWGFNPTIMRLKIQWFPYSTKSSSAPFLLPRTSQSILHSDCFNWFKHISQEFKRFQTATWS